MPTRWNASAPRSLAASTAGTQPNDLASSSQAAIAPGQASGSPSGSPAASETVPTTR